MEPPTYSIVIPACNEHERIAHALDQVLAYIEQQQWNAEIIVVDDGSSDDTAQIVREYAGRNPQLRLLSNERNRGKGYSVRKGMCASTGDLLLFTDADLSAPIAESQKLFAALAGGADIAIGSRWLQRSTQLRRQPWYRQLGGRFFNLVLRVALNLPYKDTQCGFKAFTQHAAATIFPMQRVEGWGFDPELLFLARRFRLRTVEVPVLWSDDDRSRINPYLDGFKILGEMLAVRWNQVTGKYPRPESANRE